MTVPPGTPLSKGMMMIAAYRAERLSKRAALRTTRPEGQSCGEPTVVAAAATPEVVSTDSKMTGAEAASVITRIVGISVAEEQTDADQREVSHVKAAATADTRAADDDNIEVQPIELNEGTHADLPVMPSQEMAMAGQSESAAPSAQVIPPELEAAAAEIPLYDPPLSEIGFGPGMCLRLNQLGLCTASDLARADAGELRSSLGDISRLVDVDGWIRSAEQAARSAR